MIKMYDWVPFFREFCSRLLEIYKEYPLKINEVAKKGLFKADENADKGIFDNRWYKEDQVIDPFSLT